MLEANAMVTYDSNSQQLSVDNVSAGSENAPTLWDWPYYWDTHYHYGHTWYPSITYEKSKIEQAFRILQKLMEKKIIKELMVKQFIELVNDIANVI